MISGEMHEKIFKQFAKAFLGIICSILNSISRNNSLGRDITPPDASIISATSSVSSLSMDSTSSGQNKGEPYQFAQQIPTF